MEKMLQQILVHVGETKKAIQNLETDTVEIRNTIRDLHQTGVTKTECKLLRNAPKTEHKRSHRLVTLLVGIATLIAFIGSVTAGVIKAGRYMENIDQKIESLSKKKP
jgi:hypothetical protein